MVPCFSASSMACRVFIIHVNIYCVKMVREQHLELHSPKTLQSGVDLAYAKKEINTNPLAYMSGRVHLSVEYIRGCKKNDSTCMPAHFPSTPGLMVAGMENNDSSPLHFSSYLREQISTSPPTMRQYRTHISYLWQRLTHFIYAYT